jgi:hypothetical protein
MWGRGVGAGDNKPASRARVGQPCRWVGQPRRWVGLEKWIEIQWMVVAATVWEGGDVGRRVAWTAGRRATAWDAERMEMWMVVAATKGEGGDVGTRGGMDCREEATARDAEMGTGEDDGARWGGRRRPRTAVVGRTTAATAGRVGPGEDTVGPGEFFRPLGRSSCAGGGVGDGRLTHGRQRKSWTKDYF